jgi:hypothetical protein
MFYIMGKLMMRKLIYINMFILAISDRLWGDLTTIYWVLIFTMPNTFMKYE